MPASPTALAAALRAFPAARMASRLVLALGALALGVPAQDSGLTRERGDWVWFDADDGLPGAPVHDLEEKDSRVLAATDAGLFLYDGWRFEPIDAGLPGGPVTHVSRGRGGELWVVAAGRIHRGTLERFDALALPARWESLDAGAVAHPEDGPPLAALWSRDEGRWRVIQLGARVREIATPSRATAPHAPNLRQTASGRVWLAQDDGLHVRERGGAWTRFLPCDGASAMLSALEESPALEGVAGFEQPAHMLGVWAWSPGEPPRRVEGEGSTVVAAAAIAPSGDALVALDTGEVCERKDGVWRPGGSAAAALAGATFVEPRGGDFWVARDGGVGLLRRASSRWTHLVHGGPRARENRVADFAIDAWGALWVATAGGVDVWLPDGTQRALPPPDVGWAPAFAAVGLDAEGRAWAAPGEGRPGLVRLEGDAWRAVLEDDDGLAIGSVESVVRDARGRLWFLALAAPGASAGAFLLEGDRLALYQPLEARSPGAGVHDVLLDRAGALWFATTRGVERLDAGGVWTSFDAPMTLHLEQRTNGGAWFASRTRLGWIDPSGAVRYDPSAPPAGGGYGDLAIGPRGYLWVTAGRDLFRLVEGAWVEVDVAGVRGSVALGPLALHGGRLWVGTRGRGAYELVLPRAESPPRALALAHEVEPDGAHVLRWTASARWAETPAESVLTRHRLDGAPWSPWSLAREARVEAWEPGEHTLEVQAASVFGGTGEPARLTVDVAPSGLHDPRVLVPAGAIALLLVGLGVALGMRHRRGAAALRRRERELRLLLDEALDAILIFDGPEPRVLDGNACAAELFELEREALQGRRLAELLDGFDALRAAELVQEGEIVQEFRARRRGGAPVEIEASMRVIEGWRGLAILRDLTERRHLESERREFDRRLAETQKLESLGRLAGGVAHDFNNLLMIVGGSAEQARRLVGPDSPAGPALARIQTSVARAGELTQHLLAYAGRKSLRREPVDLAALTADVVALTRSSLPENARIELALPPDLPSALGDSGGLHQVLLNLVLNAGEALRPEGGTILIGARVARTDDLVQSSRGWTEAPPAGRWLALEVADEGVGMDDATLRHAFDPFFTTKASGHGLGLAAVRGILRSLGGYVRVTSAVGAGTRFTVLLPVSPKPAAARASAAPSAWRTRGRVLVVDDEPEVRQVLREMLEDLGLEVEEAGGGGDAIGVHASGTRRIDCTLLDVSMPDLGGFETARRIRTLDPDAPVILMSGFHETADGDLVPNGFLQKPFRSDEVAQLLRSVLHESRGEG